jgi:uncharacterized Zn finger protein
MSWGRRRGRGGDGDWGGWPRYVPVAERRAKAQKQAEKLRKKGQPLAPVVIAGRTIAATFWGKAWCENLERYGDYENRIPRGRAYVRNGSVVDLKIGKARVDALVSGSHLYSVEIEIHPLKAGVWKGVKGACTGRIGSLLELLQGKLSREVMEIVTRSRTGLFPEPAEISFHCSCPDWASMCKHVAAVLYGVGARLDREPELLFKLRGVDHRELIAAPGAADPAASPATREKIIAEEDLAGIFGIEIDEGPAALRPAPETPKRGRPRLAPKPEAPIKPRRGKPPLVHAETLMPRQKRTASIPMEKPEPLTPKRGRRPIPATPTEAPEQTRLQRARMPKPADPAETPEPPKRKRGRPRLTPKPGSADQAAPLPEKTKRKKPLLRPDFIRALREVAARQRRNEEEAIHPRKKSVSRKGSAGRDTTLASAPIPTRRRSRQQGKRKA